jgi:hypothetical protein
MLLKTDNTTRSDPDAIEGLEKKRGRIRSRQGGWIPGKGVFNHGFSMLEDLVGKKTFMQIVVLNATGKLVSKPLADWIEAIYGCLSWPDPRIWCNHIGALAGEAQTSVTAATVAGTLAADSRAYGQKTLVAGLTFIQTARALQRSGDSARDIIDREVKANRGKVDIVGFARPLAKGDERLTTMESVTQELGFDKGEHLCLAYEIEQVLVHDYGESMNINGYMSAFLSDQGFTPEEVYRIYSVMVFSGVTACYVEYADRPAHDFLPLRCDDISYIGPSVRTLI